MPRPSNQSGQSYIWRRGCPAPTPERSTPGPSRASSSSCPVETPLPPQGSHQMLKTVDSHMWGAAEARRRSLVRGSTCLSIQRKRAPRCWPIGVQRPLWRPIHVATRQAVRKWSPLYVRREKCQCSGQASWLHAGSSRLVRRHGMSRRLHSPVRGGRAVLPRPEAQERAFVRGDRGRAECQQAVEDRGASAVGGRGSGVGCRASGVVRDSRRIDSS